MTRALDFIHDTTFDSLPANTIHEAKRCLVDTLGVAVGGAQTAMSRIMREHAAGTYAAGKASLWQDGRLVHPAAAALANATTIDALDAHDGHKLTKGHVGCGVLPGLIAFMQAQGVSDPQELLTGIVIGYEIGTRAGITLHASACDYHTSGAWVCLAVAALGARHLGLDSERTREALGIAEYYGPRSQMMRVVDQPVMVKDGSGWGAMAGVSAAYLAQDGFTGAPAVTMEDPNLTSYWNDLGRTWHIADQYIKLYPVCRWAQPAIEAVLAVVREQAVTADQVAKVHVETFHQARRLGSIPTNTEQAQYSLPFSVAAALVRGTIGVPEVTEDGLTDARILHHAKLVEVTETDAYNAAFPMRRFARVHLHMKDGRILSSDTTEARGDPENKLSDTVIHDKFRQLTEPVHGSGWADAFITTAMGLDSDAGVDRLFKMISDKPAQDAR